MDRRGPGDAAVVQAVFDEAIALHRRVRDTVQGTIVEAAGAITSALAAGGKVLVFGNGGSATDAQHFAAELVGRFERERAGFAALALTTDGSVITSVANDYTFDRIFARQIEALGRPGDLAIALSTSGRSPNVIAGLRSARSAGLSTAAFGGGQGGMLPVLADPVLLVPAEETSRIQEMHITLGHMLCAALESELGLGEV